VLVWLSFRGWSVLVLAPVAAMIAAAAAQEPLLANWTITFMGAAAGFILQFFPLFLLGAVFGKLMEDSGSVAAIARWMTERLGAKRAVLAVVLAGTAVTYGGVSLFVASSCWCDGAGVVPRGGHPEPADAGGDRAGTMTFTMSSLPGTPAIQNAIPMPFFGTTPFAAPGLGIIASAVMLAFGLWWLARAEHARGARARVSAPRCRAGTAAGDPRSRTGHDGQCVRSRGDPARPPEHRSPGSVRRRAAADRGGGGQPGRVAAGAAAPRSGLPVE